MPTSILRTVTVDDERIGRRPPGRRSNVEYGRERKYLTPAEIDRLVIAAKKRGRYGQRDAWVIPDRGGVWTGPVTGFRACSARA